MLKKFIGRIREMQRLKRMDDMWRMTGQSSWSLFPPSFYATHTKEEAEKAEREEIAECRKLLEQLK